MNTFFEPSISESVPNEEKNALLRTIKNVLDTSFLEATSAGLIRGNIERYNTIRDKEDSLKPHISYDPLDVLPLEVWEEVIHECTSPDPNRPLEWSLDKLIELTAVSEMWRVTILQTPSFWRNITTSERTEDLQAKVVLCLSLSADCLLDISVRFPTPCWETLGPIIGAQSFRIRSITLGLPYYDQPILPDGAIESVLAYFGELSSLEEFVFDGMDYEDMGSTFRSTNSISKVQGNITSEILGMQSLAGLQYFHTRLPFVDIFPYLPDLKHLKEVSFDGNPYIHYFLDSQEGAAPATAPKQSLTWTSFNYTQSPLLYFDGFYSHFASTLQRLSIGLYWERLGGLLNAYAEMHKLRSLNVTVYHLSRQVVDLAIAYPSSIQALSLTLRRQHENKDDDPVYDRNVNRIFKTLITWVPSVEFLEILTEATAEHAFSYVKSLQRLKNFKYTHTGKYLLPKEFVALPNIEEIHLDLPGSSWSSYIYCPKALSLLYSTTSWAPQRQEVSLWSNLRSLYLEAMDVTWTDISLPRVKRIKLSRPSYHSWNNPLSTDLCRGLARRPTAFPSLENLQFQFFPEWDILFIMLERRNFLMDDTISRIHTIGFPVLPPLTILQAISYRLGGRLSERPSNYDLSTFSQLETYFDAKIPGCTTCHRGFFHCAYYRPETRFDKIFYPPDKFSYNTQRHRAPSYPLTADEVISSHEDRQNWFFNACLRSKYLNCPRYDNNKYQEITAFIQPDLSGSPY